MTLKIKPLMNFRSKLPRIAILLTAIISVLIIAFASIALLASDSTKGDELEYFEIVNGVLKEYQGTNENVVIPDGVEEIGQYAFEDCFSITTVTIPDGVEKIGKCAFEDCFKITTVTIPDSVQEINERAFYGTGLKKVYIPKNVTFIDKNAFLSEFSMEIEVDPQNQKYCTKDGVLYNKDMTELIRYYDKEDVFYFKIPESVKKISDSAFFDCEVTDIYIPSSVKEIGDYAFLNCRDILTIKVDKENKNYIVKDNIMFTKDMTELIWYSKGNTAKSYAIPDGITTIRAGTFEKCEALENITIPNSVKIIGDNAFKSMIRLKTLTIPDSVSEIGDTAFFRSFQLTDSANLYVDENSKYFTIKDGILYNKDMTELIFCLNGYEIREYTIPDTVKIVRAYAFYNCGYLEEVKIPDSVTMIGEAAFDSCVRLTSIDLPKKITSIADSTFSNCLSLESVNIPDSVTSIGDNAFRTGSCVTYIKLPKSLQKIGNDAFGCDLKSIDIPKDTVEIADNAFDECNSIKSINVDDENKIYYSKDGVLFNKKMMKLIKYPGGKEDSHYTVPEGVKTVREHAFSNSGFLKSIDIPDSVEFFSNGVFNYTESSLTSINVNTGNKNYASKDGVLYNRNMKELILYPYNKSGKEYAIPEGVTTINENAFVSCYNLLQLTIPKSVVKIGEQQSLNQKTGFSIKGYENSVAQEFAVSHNIPFVSVRK